MAVLSMQIWALDIFCRHWTRSTNEPSKVFHKLAQWHHKLSSAFNTVDESHFLVHSCNKSVTPRRGNSSWRHLRTVSQLVVTAQFLYAASLLLLLFLCFHARFDVPVFCLYLSQHDCHNISIKMAATICLQCFASTTCNHISSVTGKSTPESQTSRERCALRRDSKETRGGIACRLGEAVPGIRDSQGEKK